jgi:hypothetical protein
MYRMKEEGREKGGGVNLGFGKRKKRERGCHTMVCMIK